MIGKINKSELLNKIQNLHPNDVKKLGLTNDEINFIKNRLLNDKLGLQLNFSEIDEKLEQNYLGLKDKGGFSFNLKEKDNNLLIEGENYHALKALSIANVKVDIIYIDPPYNTGKEFIYNDNYTSLEKNNVVNKDDQFKHSKWLSFMKRRLKLAKELLKDDGVIFISIDDNEQAYLKVLMDEVFGEDNFICNFIRKTRAGGGYANSKVGINNDFVLCYQKTDLVIIDGIKKNAEDLKTFKNIDDDGQKYKWRDLIKTSSEAKKSDRESMHFTIEINGKEIIPKLPNGDLGRWTVGWQRYLELKKNNMLKIDNGRVYRKEYANEFTTVESILPNFLNSNGTSILEKLLNEKECFSNPKPPSLISYLINLISNKNALVLDFFAGSGTTGQAVMELNEEDGGNRRFILITNNENDIARKICYERLYRVISGIGTNGESFDWKYSDSKKSLLNNSLRYLTIKEINKINGEYEDINSMKQLFKEEFNKDISIKDFFDY